MPPAPPSPATSTTAKIDIYHWQPHLLILDSIHREETKSKTKQSNYQSSMEEGDELMWNLGIDSMLSEESRDEDEELKSSPEESIDEDEELKSSPEESIDDDRELEFLSNLDSSTTCSPPPTLLLPLLQPNHGFLLLFRLFLPSILSFLPQITMTTASMITKTMSSRPILIHLTPRMLYRNC